MDPRYLWRNFKGKTERYWKYAPKSVRDDLNVLESEVVPIAAYPAELSGQLGSGDFKGAWKTTKSLPGHFERANQHLINKLTGGKGNMNSLVPFGFGRPRKKVAVTRSKAATLRQLMMHPAVQNVLGRVAKGAIRRRASAPVARKYGPVRKKTLVRTFAKKRGSGYRQLVGRGTLAGKFKVPRFIRPSNATKFGSVLMWDRAGQHSVPGAECLYIGHSSLAPGRLVLSVFMTLVRKLFGKAGIPVRSFRDEVWNNYSVNTGENYGSIYFEYRHRDATTGWTANILLGRAMVAEDTFISVAEACVTAFKTFYAALDEEAQRTLILTSCWYTSSVSPQSLKHAKLILSSAMVNISMSSKLKIQNISTAEAGAVGDHAHELVGHVEQNPMVGKAYDTQSCNGFTPKMQLDGSPPEFVADNDTGFFEAESGDAAIGSRYEADLKRPPSRFYFKKVSKVASVGINPGAIRYSQISSSKKVPLSRLFRILRGYLAGSGTNELAFYGYSRMFALEKAMHTDSAAEPAIRCAWECHGTVSTTMYCPSQCTAPAVLYDTTTGTGDL